MAQPVVRPLLDEAVSPPGSRLFAMGFNARFSFPYVVICHFSLSLPDGFLLATNRFSVLFSPDLPVFVLPFFPLGISRSGRSSVSDEHRSAGGRLHHLSTGTSHDGGLLLRSHCATQISRAPPQARQRSAPAPNRRRAARSRRSLRSSKRRAQTPRLRRALAMRAARTWRYDHTLLKTKKKVAGDMVLLFTCYNLRRAMSIFGVAELIKRIESARARLFGEMDVHLRRFTGLFFVIQRSVVKIAA